MKQLLLFFAILTLSFAAQAQQREVTKDSSWITTINGQFFAGRLIEYSNGESTLGYRIIGDTATLYSQYLYSAIQQANDMAMQMRSVSEYTTRITDLIRTADAASLITGRSVLDSVRTLHQALFLAGDWNLISGDSTYTVTFSVNQAGALRYRLNGGTARTANLLGDIIRLRNFPNSSTHTDLVRLPNGRYVDVGRQHRLAPPGVNNRSAAPPPAAGDSEPPPTQLAPTTTTTRKARKQ